MTPTGIERPTRPLGDGARLAQWLLPDQLTQTYLPSIMPTERLSDIQEIAGVMVVGPLKSGKRPIIGSIESASEHDQLLKGKIDAPRRWTTRQYREGDNFENDHPIDPQQFEERVIAGEIDFHWARNTGEGKRPIRYGFKMPRVGIIPIYLGSSSFLANPASVHPTDILDKLLVIEVYAPEAERRAKMYRDSPHPDGYEEPPELTHRLRESGVNQLGGAHIIVDNSSRARDDAPRDVVSLIRGIVRLKTPTQHPL